MFQDPRVRHLVVVLCLSSLLCAHVTQAAPPLLDWLRPSTWKRNGKGIEPESCVDPAIETLAANVDWLEHHINAWGSVAPKTPDVWGEARLTKYRREVEQELADELDGFDPDRLNGSQAVTDTAFLAAAMSMDSRASLGDGLLAGDDGGVAAPQATVNFANVDADGRPVADIDVQPQQARPLFADDGHVQIQGTFGVEQVAQLDQLKRYLDHLNELRRINEGDDDADAPGYSLNLVRIPVSVMPGSRSRQGYGAEITFTATPVVDESLLPKVFRDLVINDLVDQLSVPLTMFINQAPVHVNLDEAVDQAIVLERALPAINRAVDQFNVQLGPVINAMELQAYADRAGYQFHNHDVASSRFQDPVDVINFDEFLLDVYVLGCFLRDVEQQDIDPQLPDPLRRQVPGLESLSATVKAERSNVVGIASVPIDHDQRRVGILAASELDEATIADLPAFRSSNTEELDRKAAVLQAFTKSNFRGLSDALFQLTSQTQFQGFIETARSMHLPNASVRRSTLPYPPRHLADNLGLLQLAYLMRSTRYAFKNELLNRQVVHVTDMQGLLREELTAAYRMLMRPAAAIAWNQLDGPALAEAIRGRRRDVIAAARRSFLDVTEERTDKTTPALAWAIVVESVLLSDRLNEQIAAQQSGLSAQDGFPTSLSQRLFYGPEPSAEARSAFADFVAHRWPLKVFTIDPVATEQNIADSSSVYRQMQLAVSLAFASGQIGVGGALSMMRAIQRDIATIDLNRVAVGFAHGPDTFGWRFYPRFQTPPVEGNLTVAMRDLIAGGPSDRQLLRKKELEPGMRECVAVIITPSFVSDMVIESRSAWFRLDKPGHVAPSNQETVRFSRNITSMRNTANQCVQRPDLYRDGEVGRLLTRVGQLDRSLPLQTLHCNLPTENTLGGFELLASGRRELAPELLGWYGSPGYDVTRGGAFFLTGDNLSVHETRVIAGNTTIGGADATLISRQVLEVDLPPGLPIVRDERIANASPGDYGGYINVHVASPYGVSGHLLVPVVRENVTRLPPTDPPSTSPPTPPGLLGHAMTIDVVAEWKNASWSVDSMTPQSLSLATVQFADHRDVPEGKLAVTFTPMSPQGALSTFTFDEVTIQPSGDVLVGGAETLSNLSGSANMRASLKRYVEWLLSVAAVDGTLDQPMSITLPMTATVGVGSNVGPTAGQAVVKLLVSKKPD